MISSLWFSQCPCSGDFRWPRRKKLDLRLCLEWVYCKKFELNEFMGFSNCLFSICAMTLARLLISQYYKLDNYTRQAAIVGFITGLEPMFGVINVCLPFFPVMVTHVSKSKFISRLSRTTRSSTKGTVNTKRGSGIRADSSGQFRGLDNVNLAPLDIPGRAYVSTNYMDVEHPGAWGSNTLGTKNSIIVRKDVFIERSV